MPRVRLASWPFSVRRMQHAWDARKEKNGGTSDETDRSTAVKKWGEPWYVCQNGGDGKFRVGRNRSEGSAA